MTYLQNAREVQMNIPSPYQTKLDYTEFIAGYKTSSAKKSAMTKDIKRQIEFISDLQESLKRHKNGNAWHLGVVYNRHDLQRAIKNLNIMFSIKNSIN